jgi:outer membrane receptor for ferrienterochelin and colicins
MRKILTFLLFFIFVQQGIAQKDSSVLKQSTLDEIVITSTRTETKLSNVAVPTTIINQKTIQQAGSLRLKDILQEQAGLNIINNGFGQGVQMQGLSADYTIILLNGQPLVGRTSGVLDLNRIGINNIKKIEIVKGPSSSLYGSEAMAGVINIITDNNFKPASEIGIRYGFGNADKQWILPADKTAAKNFDFNFSGATQINKTGIHFSSDAYYVDAVSIRPYSSQLAVQPIWRLTNQLILNQKLSARTSIDLNIRNSYDYLKQDFAVSNLGAVSTSYGHETNNDLNIYPSITHVFNPKIKSSLKLYATKYSGIQKLYFVEKQDSTYSDEFYQNYYRVENQTDFNFKKNRLTVGAGYNIDEARSSRYDNVSSNKQNTIVSLFTQNEWTPSKKLTVIAGLRYDNNKLFASAFSPKFAIRYKVNDIVSLNASIGRGFKAPDFRQLFLNFTNNAAGGYSVFGTIDAIKIIEQLQQLGQIGNLSGDFYKLSTLKPEFSTGINIGGNINIHNNFKFNFNFYRNDIENLIDVKQVATRTNGTQIFSYINVKRAYTQGFELESTVKINQQLSISSGYQFILTADKDELENIRNGKVYTRNTDGTVRLMKESEYIGLSNRSKHMGNLKLNFENKNYFASVRLLYKSDWYISDRNGNGLIDKNDEKANGYFLLNLSAGKEISKTIKVKLGVDNLTNYQDKNYIPSLQCRTIYVSANFKLK